MKLTRIYDGKASREKTFELINRGYSPDVMSAGQWFEIEEEEYWYFLECLPPMDYGPWGFSMCEFSTGYLTNAFADIRGRFYCITIERKSPADFEAAMLALSKELRAMAA